MDNIFVQCHIAVIVCSKKGPHEANQWVYLLIQSKRSTAPKFGASSKILNKRQVALCFCQRKTHVFERATKSSALNKQMGDLKLLRCSQ